MNSQRRRRDASGRTFMPKNMDIGDRQDSFMSTPKLFMLVGIFLIFVVWFLWAGTIGLSKFGYMVTGVPVLFIVQLIVRYGIFQEKYYYKIWQRDKQLGNPTASAFWNVASIRTSSLGDVLVFADLKIGCVLELEKDTIIGRASDNQEKHYDAWSEFYKALNLKDYSFVQLNIMEPAGKDVRLQELSDIAVSSPNAGVQMVLEASVGYMKEISRATLNERDYILVYTKKTSKMDTIVEDAIEFGSKLLEGSYAAVKVLSSKEAFNVMRDLWNVNVFNGIEAQMDVYRHAGYKIEEPLKVVTIFKDNFNTQIELDKKATDRLKKASKLLDNSRISVAEWDIGEILEGKYDAIDLDTVLDVTYSGDVEETVQKVNERNRKIKEYQEKRLEEAKNKKAKSKEKSKNPLNLFKKSQPLVKKDNQENINQVDENTKIDDSVLYEDDDYDMDFDDES